MAGGEDVGDVDVGSGPARVFSPAALAAIARDLTAIPGAKLAARSDKTSIALDAFTDLRAWLVAGARAKRGLIVWCC